jgi:hypothetical protein
VLLGAVVGAGIGAAVDRRLCGEVEPHFAALELSTILGVVRLLGSLRGVEVDIAKATGPAGFLVGDNASTSEVLKALELLEEDVIINDPAEVADPKSGALLALFCLLGLVLLDGSLGLLFGLPLLRGCLLLGLDLLRLAGIIIRS